MVLFIALALTTFGCQRDNESTPPPVATSAVPDTAHPEPPPTAPEVTDPSALLEFASLAIPQWRALNNEQPTLVLISQDPFLQLIPESRHEAAATLVRNGSAEELRRHAAPDRPDPHLLPSQVLRAALDAGFFSRVIWILPTKESPQTLDVEIFRRQLFDSGLLDEQEVQTLAADPRGFRLTLAGIPLEAVVPGHFPEISGPVALHVDLGFFQALYRNEVKSPVFELMRETLSELPMEDLDLRAATLSMGQGEGRVSVDMRFLGHRLARIFTEPGMLTRPQPRAWHEHGDILYLATFLEMDRVLETAREAAARWTDDAPLQFELYRALRTRRAGSEALEALARTVALDPGYAVEYLNLAALARTRELPDQELRMLEMAAAEDSRNPFLPLRMAEVYLELGKALEAAELLRELADLPWSEVHYPWIPQYIASLMED
ncbi:hypothetical protein SAMN05660860_03462 [Geoalkalibacter ferrihydriticus]|nr:hypothetical protein SAMN05660860_03462 [Geoalkalibacter ferrihydriticus]